MEESISKIIKRSQGTSRDEVLKKAAKLNAHERVALIKFFDIEPQDLAGTLVYFWLTPKKGIGKTGSGGPLIAGNEYGL